MQSSNVHYTLISSIQIVCLFVAQLDSKMFRRNSRRSSSSFCLGVTPSNNYLPHLDIKQWTAFIVLAAFTGSGDKAAWRRDVGVRCIFDVFFVGLVVRAAQRHAARDARATHNGQHGAEHAGDQHEWRAHAAQKRQHGIGSGALTSRKLLASARSTFLIVFSHFTATLQLLIASPAPVA
jgi:hypothetical protein